MLIFIYLILTLGQLTYTDNLKCFTLIWFDVKFVTATKRLQVLYDFLLQFEVIS